MADSVNDNQNVECVAVDIFDERKIVLAAYKRIGERYHVHMRRYWQVVEFEMPVFTDSLRIFLVSEKEIMVFYLRDDEFCAKRLEYSKGKTTFNVEDLTLVSDVKVEKLKELSTGPQRTFYNAKCERLYGNADISNCKESSRRFYDVGTKSMTATMDDSVNNVINCNEFSDFGDGKLQVNFDGEKHCYSAVDTAFKQVQIWNKNWGSSGCQSIDCEPATPAPGISEPTTKSPTLEPSRPTTDESSPSGSLTSDSSPPWTDIPSLGPDDNANSLVNSTELSLEGGHVTLCYSLMALGFVLVLVNGTIIVAICKGWIPGAYSKRKVKLKQTHDAVLG